MDFEKTVAQLRNLLERRDEIDQELHELLGKKVISTTKKSGKRRGRPPGSKYPQHTPRTFDYVCNECTNSFKSNLDVAKTDVRCPQAGCGATDVTKTISPPKDESDEA